MERMRKQIYLFLDVVFNSFFSLITAIVVAMLLGALVVYINIPQRFYPEISLIKHELIFIPPDSQRRKNIDLKKMLELKTTGKRVDFHDFGQYLEAIAGSKNGQSLISARVIDSNTVALDYYFFNPDPESFDSYFTINYSPLPQGNRFGSYAVYQAEISNYNNFLQIRRVFRPNTLAFLVKVCQFFAAGYLSVLIINHLFAKSKLY